MEDKCSSFRLKSKNNYYIIEIKTLNKENPQKLEISLIHKLPIEDKKFFLQKSKDALTKENDIFSQFNSIQEIYNYLIKIIKSQQIKIIKPEIPEISNYFIYFFDQENQLDFQITIPKIQNENIEIINVLKEDIKSQAEEIKQLKKEVFRLSNFNFPNGIQDIFNNNNYDNEMIKMLQSKIKEQAGEIKELKKQIKQLSDKGSINIKSNIELNNNDNIILGECLESENNIHRSGLQEENEKNILKENNNNISFKNIPNNLDNEKIISDGNEECENFTAFINKNYGSIIVWTIKGKGILNLYDFKKIRKKSYKAHDKNIDCIQYFHDHNELIDYIISLSKLDEDTLKIWKIDYDNDSELKLAKIFRKQFFQKEVELFCTFNYNDYDNSNSYLFIYGKPLLNKKIYKNNINPNKIKEIICYKLDKNLNHIIWERSEEEIINYKRINNFYKINNLDTYYDFNKNKELYLINCNENNTEIINKLFDYYRGSIFKFKEWNYYQSAFIKEIDNNLKLFQISIIGLAIWDINKKEVEASISFEDCCLFDFISWNDNYLLVIGFTEIIILEINGKKIEKKYNKKKVEGYSKIRKIITPESYEIVVSIEDHKVKYWSL